MPTIFEDIRFNEVEHRYFYHGRELTSVTKKLKELQKPFDRDSIAMKTAKKEGRTVADVLAGWDRKGEEARQLGIVVHSHIEQVIKGKVDPLQAGFDEFLALNQKIPQIEAFEEIWRQVGVITDIRTNHVEMVVGDDKLGLAGMVDTVLWSKKDGCFHIWDWKTGKFDISNQWENLLPPFDDLEASKLNIYSLQVSLYSLIIERNTDMPMGTDYLVHLMDGGYKIYQVIDYKDRLLAWLNGK